MPSPMASFDGAAAAAKLDKEGRAKDLSSGDGNFFSLLCDLPEPKGRPLDYYG